MSRLSAFPLLVLTATTVVLFGADVKVKPDACSAALMDPCGYVNILTS